MEESKEKVQVTKPSYEQLEKENLSLKGMNNQLIMQLQSMNITTLFKRLDYLFKVVEFKDAFSTGFVTKCTKEIERHMTPPEESDKSENKD